MSNPLKCSPHPSGPSSVASPASAQRTTRQLWGLTARCERAIRAIAPHLREQKAVWGEEAAVLFQRLLLPSTWLCEKLMAKSISCPPVALRLLTSTAVTAAKAAQMTGLDTSALLSSFLFVLDLWTPPAMTAAVAGGGALPFACPSFLPAIVTLLLPRVGAAAARLPEGPPKFIAAIFALTSAFQLAEAGTLPQPSAGYARSASVLRMLSSSHISALARQLLSQMTAGGATGHARFVAPPGGIVLHLAVGGLSHYVWLMVSGQWSQATKTAAICDRGGAAAASSAAVDGPSPQAELRALLAWTIPSLLGSPLLDFLVVMQHVVVTARSGQGWSLPAAGIPPVHLMPVFAGPDAANSNVALQVDIDMSRPRIYI